VDLGTYAAVFVGGASAIALWMYYRGERFAPRDLRAAILHLGAAFVVCQVLAPALGAMLRSTNSDLLSLISVMAVSLPALVYTMLAVIWVIALIQSTLRSSMLR
jgi:hypothetical protein